MSTLAMSAIPSSWCLAHFNDAFDVISDRGQRVAESDYISVGELPVIDQGEEFIGGYSDDLEKKYLGPLPVIVFGDHTRRIKYVTEPFAVGAQGVKLLAPTGAFDPKFLFYLVPTLELPDRGYSRHFQFLRKLAFVMPPINEQRRIVSAIELQLTRVDTATTALKHVQANLKRYRASVLKAACEGRLVPTEAELARKEGRTYETGQELLARILKERRAKWEADQLAKMVVAGKVPKDDGWKTRYREPAGANANDLPSLPDGWAWATWNQISNWITYGFTRPMPHVESGVPIVTARHVSGDRINFDDCDFTTANAFAELSPKDRPEFGDILITKEGTIGRAAVVETQSAFCINQSVAVAWLRDSPVHRRYLLSVIHAPRFQQAIWAKARGPAIQHLSITDFGRMAVPLPPIREQKRIGECVSERLSAVDHSETGIAQTLRRAQHLRSAILKRAFQGKLVPQDPNDEPASVLLESIRATRNSAPPARRSPRKRLGKTVTAVAASSAEG